MSSDRCELDELAPHSSLRTVGRTERLTDAQYRDIAPVSCSQPLKKTSRARTLSREVLCLPCTVMM